LGQRKRKRNKREMRRKGGRGGKRGKKKLENSRWLLASLAKNEVGNRMNPTSLREKKSQKTTNNAVEKRGTRKKKSRVGFIVSIR